MRRDANSGFLNTVQVARLCGTNQSTIQYAARVGDLRGSKVGGRWQFSRADAERYRDALLAKKRGKTSRRLVFARFGRGMHKLIALLHLLGTIVSLATAAGDDQYSWVGWPLGALNLLAAGWGYVSWRRTEPSEDDWVDGQPVDRDAVGLHVAASPQPVPGSRERARAGAGPTPFVIVMHITILAATVLYADDPETPFTLFSSDDGPEIPTIASTLTAPAATTADAVTIPSAVPPFETPTPTERVPSTTSVATSTLPPTVDEPTVTPEPTEVTPTVTPSPTLTPTPCDVDSCVQSDPTRPGFQEEFEVPTYAGIAPSDTDGPPTAQPEG